MRYRIAPLLAALVLFVACGDDKPSGNTLNDDDADPTTTVESDPGESTATTATQKIATRQILAKLVVQVDDALRVANAAARPCIVGPREQCVGEAQDAYTRLDDLAGAVRFVLDGSTIEGGELYVGPPEPSAVALIDRSLAVSDDAKAKSASAQTACLPQPGDGCADASAALDAALIELLKNTNDWREFAS